MSRKKLHYKIDSLCEQIRCILDDNGVEITQENDIEYGFQIKTDINAVLNIYVTGKIYVCGDYDASKRVRRHLLDLDVNKWLYF